MQNGTSAESEILLIVVESQCYSITEHIQHFYFKLNCKGISVRNPKNQAVSDATTEAHLNPIFAQHEVKIALAYLIHLLVFIIHY